MTLQADVSKAVDGAENSRGTKESSNPNDGPNLAEMVRNKVNR